MIVFNVDRTILEFNNAQNTPMAYLFLFSPSSTLIKSLFISRYTAHFFIETSSQTPILFNLLKISFRLESDLYLIMFLKTRGENNLNKVVFPPPGGA